MDADCGQYEITPADAKGFRPGMGVCLWDRDRGWVFHGRPLRVKAVEGGRLLLEDMIPDHDRAAERDGRVVNYFPLVMAREADRSRVGDHPQRHRPGLAGPGGPWTAGVFFGLTVPASQSAASTPITSAATAF